MKKIWISLLALSMLLTSCAISNLENPSVGSSEELPTDRDKLEQEHVERENPSEGNSEGLPFSGDNSEQEYVEAVKNVELPALKADGDTLVLDTSGYKIQSGSGMGLTDDEVGEWGEERKERVKEFEEKYHWYGVSGVFPFTHMYWDIGMKIAGYGEEVTTQELIAAKVANLYYSFAAANCEGEDGSEYYEYESNYPQFNSCNLGKYRWTGYWYDFHNYDYFSDNHVNESEDTSEENKEWTFNPLQPKDYTVPIEIDVAEMDIYTYGYMEEQYCIEHRISQKNDWDYEYWDNASLAEKVFLQNQYMTHCWKALEEPYCAVSGLTVLNGDSRTEESYFAGSRAKNIRITINDEYVKELRLADTPAPQLIDLDYVQHTLAKPAHIKIEVLDSYIGTSDKIYITEIGVGIQTNFNQTFGSSLDIWTMPEEYSK